MRGSNSILLTAALLVALALVSKGQAAYCQEPNERVVEMRADRVVIYPQRMQLDDEATLMDVLMMYPDLMQEGFEELVQQYNVRLNNTTVNLDPRIFLNQLKAKYISRIQICDNSGVAKGTSGLNRVIDVNLLNFEKGFHGQSGLQLGSDLRAVHNVETRLESDYTDLYATASYAYRRISDKDSHRQHLSAHMINSFSPYDKLQSYLTQMYADGTQKYSARATYNHIFNDKGTDLMFLAGCQYSNIPKIRVTDDFEYLTTRGEDFYIGVIELNTPICKGLDMMLGWEGDFDISRLKLPEGKRQNYTLFNNDIYLQFNYVYGLWKFTVGDRLMFYRYGVGNDSHNDIRNNVEVSAIANMGRHSQFQVAYHRKFSNPAFSFDDEISEEEWIVGKESLRASYINEIKLAYNYSRPNFTYSLGSYFLGMQNSDNIWKLCTSLFWKWRFISLTAGINFYDILGPQSDFATFHIAPRLNLPLNFQLGAQAVFAAGGKRLAHDERVYMALQIHKQFGSHFNISLDWHDIFGGRQWSACLLSAQYRF